MEKIPAVSVVVPVYNVEIYVKQCVDSILNQTFQDFEIILVDDASPDKSFELCQKLYGGNDKVRIIRHEKNLGLGPARNTGIKNARGKYIYFVDSDDFIFPEALQKFYTAAEKNNAQVVHAAGRYELFQDEPEPIRRENMKLEWDKYNQEGFLTNNVLQRLEKNWKAYDTWSMAWLCFCRRDFLEEKQIEFLPIISEDETFSFELFCLTERYYVIQEAFYVYRRRTGSIMSSFSPDKFSKGISSLVIGSTYIKRLLENIPRFENYEQWCEAMMNACFLRFSSQVLPYYNKPEMISRKNTIVKEALTPFFGEGEFLVRFLLNNYYFYFQQASFFSQKNAEFSSQIMALFNRVEISSNKVVFNNFMGKGYGCNPKYIAQEILKQNLPYDLVWLVSNLNEPMPDKIRKVLYGSIDSVYELATAKVIVTNVKNLLPFPAKKPGQYFIMTWHGGQGFKFVEKDVEEKLSPAYVRDSKINSQITDLMLAHSQEQFDEMRRAFWYSGEIMRCGLPRNDIFFRNDAELILRIRKSLNIPDDNKVIMYAPTFRDNPAIFDEVYNFDAKRLLQVVEKKFGGKWTLLVRFHPNIAATNFAQKFLSGSRYIINATNYPDIQELIVASDVLISDYSGVIYDFMLCGKPVFIFAKDLDTYPKERGFKQAYFDLPYKVNRTEGELLNCIKNFNAKALEPAIGKFFEQIKPFGTGHASETVVARIKAVIGKQAPPTLFSNIPNEIASALDDWRTFHYVRERYSEFLHKLPVYESGGVTPKIFWWCWLQGEENAPPLCKVCLKSLRKNYPDYKINVVTMENISDFVSFPPHIVEKFNAGKISRTHFSDLLRLELLINHGGIWIDSTVFCTGREQNYLREPLFIFQSTWRNSPAHLGSNWFIVSQKDNPILKTTRDLLYKYWLDHDELGAGGFYFIFHCMFHLAAEKYPELWAKVPVFSNVPPHLLQFGFFKQYDPDHFEQIKSGAHFHKLTWKYPPNLLTPEKTAGTYYEHLMKFYS